MIDFDAIVTAVRPYTMVCDDGVKFAAQCAIEAKGGFIVECGVWRGGSSLAMLLAQRMACGLVTPVFMFDSFEGMPAPGQEDGNAAAAWHRGADPSPFYYDNCRAERAGVDAAFQLFGFRPDGIDYRIVAGRFEKTAWAPLEPHLDKISLLRLDADWYEATKVCLAEFGRRLIPGALVIVDDYFAWEGCKLAVDRWLAARPGIELQAMPNQSAAYFRIPA